MNHEGQHQQILADLATQAKRIEDLEAGLKAVVEVTSRLGEVAIYEAREAYKIAKQTLLDTD